MICHQQLEHAIINLPTKFEFTSFTRYGDMKGAENAQNGVVLGGLG